MSDDPATDAVYDLDGDEPMAVICDDCYRTRPWATTDGGET